MTWTPQKRRAAACKGWRSRKRRKAATAIPAKPAAPARAADALISIVLSSTDTPKPRAA